MDLQLDDKVALVTASSKGLGLATAQAFAREGAQVAMCSRSEVIHTAADGIRSETGIDVLAMQADVTEQDDIDRLIAATLGRIGQIDILVINPCRGNSCRSRQKIGKPPYNSR